MCIRDSRNFSEADAQRIKDIESVTNHDVKAVEYFLKEEFDKMEGMDDYKEFKMCIRDRINGQGDNFGYFSPVDIDEAQYRSINNMLAYKRFELLYHGVESEINSI